MKTWLKSILGGAVGATAIVALAWSPGLPILFRWVAANGHGATWAGIIVSAVGLVLVYRQLRLTARAAQSAEAGAAAAKVATDIALADTRPWLQVDIEEGSATANLRKGPPRNLQCYLRVVVTNIGRTPARDVTFHFVPLADSSDENLLKAINNLPKGGLQKTVIFPDEVRYFGSGKSIEVEESLFPPFKALIVLEYTSAVGRHVTPLLATELSWDEGVQHLGERVAEVVEEVRTVLQPT